MAIAIFFREVRQVSFFGLVGVAATATHGITSYLSVRMLEMDSTEAFLTGFFLAWWVSFLGHQSLTFQGQANWGRAFLRFIPHSLVMVTIGTIITSLLDAPALDLPPTVVPVASAGFMPVISFFSSKFLVFRTA